MTIGDSIASVAGTLYLVRATLRGFLQPRLPRSRGGALIPLAALLTSLACGERTPSQEPSLSDGGADGYPVVAGAGRSPLSGGAPNGGAANGGAPNGGGDAIAAPGGSAGASGASAGAGSGGTQSLTDAQGFPTSRKKGALGFDLLKIQGDFWGEGAALGDLDGDGFVDVINGPWAWAGPDFKSKWQFRDYDAADNNFVNGQYDPFGMADSWAAYIYDVNGDGHPDPISKGHPGNAKVTWFENTGRREKLVGHQMETDIAFEQNLFRDITGDGKPEFIAGKKGHVGFVANDWSKPAGAWQFQAISEAGIWGTDHNFYHGVGIGDINGDGRLDLLHNTGWDEQPAQPNGAWTHHDAATWPGHTTGVQFGGAHMFGYDVDGDGDTDMVTSINSHGYGLAWWEQAGSEWKRHLIFGAPGEPSEHPEITISQVHAIVVADMDGDGLLDIVTGKSYWAHPDAAGTPASEDVKGTPYLYVFRLVRQQGGVMFEPHLVGDKTGVGRQFSVGDVNADGVLDIVVGDKLGTFVYTQRR
jgi:FG-GAP-like repeat